MRGRWKQDQDRMATAGGVLDEMGREGWTCYGSWTNTDPYFERAERLAA